jgi:predicted phage tail protein
MAHILALLPRQRANSYNTMNALHDNHESYYFISADNVTHYQNTMGPYFAYNWLGS